MKREIKKGNSRVLKFRAWDEDLKMMMPEVDLSSSLQNFKWLGRADLPLMQYTGLKDKNGKEIFEGDLIECYTTNGEKVYTYPYEVKLPDFYREIWSQNEHNLLANLGEKTKVLIIGNIYENKELLTNK